ncbi:MAG: nucleoside triphosphate pyrophosphohydrolase [Bacilli bacterium]|nr:nucleoside triphosphate pyrophosphohydrolase [Bacilli bacterium]
MSYRKLVRDKIPEIIKSNGENPITKILDNDEYKIELEKKLLEECHEVINAKTKEDRLEELADLLEVMLSLSKTQNNNLEDIIDVCKTKRLKRGGFDKKIYLIDVEK